MWHFATGPGFSTPASAKGRLATGIGTTPGVDFDQVRGTSAMLLSFAGPERDIVEVIQSQDGAGSIDSCFCVNRCLRARQHLIVN
jgi:hypothetical protein